MLFELAVLTLFLMSGWLWLDAMRAREVALDVGRRACEAEGVQFLDWTVAVVRMRVKRARDGRLRVWRKYEFEFSDTGNNRLKGSLTLLGTQLESLHLLPERNAVPRIAHLH